MSNNQESIEEKLKALNNTADTTQEFDPQDIEKNKFMAILAYFGILVIIPILAAKESKFARFHSNQGLILCIAAILYSICYSILSSVILSISWHLYWLVSIIGILGFAFLIWFIIGIINAAQGKAKELPLIGHYKLLKI
ncbi:MAG: zinc ribbon domain-containing protein [Prevotella sp.]|nr:zinc ribbon domain-containing protein [Prevotella sp.]MBR1461825.1 zinc ribbon domain-containing protein [Prevotella sp.]